MRTRFVAVFGIIAAVGMVLLVGEPARPQGSGSSRVNPPQQPRRPQTVEEFAGDFWQFIVRPGSAYNTWKAVPMTPPADVQDPHGMPARSYMNSIAAGDSPAPPFGSILVRENIAKDGKTRTGFAAMYRVQGTDPKNFDWYWLQYQADGSLAKNSDNKPLAGRVSSCIECHQRAKGGDLVFSNDLPAPAPSK